MHVECGTLAAVTEDERGSGARLDAEGTGNAKPRPEAATGGRGDATLGRIADLAGGWSVGQDEPRAEPARRASLPPPRPGKTTPPPAPRAAEVRAPGKPAPAAPAPHAAAPATVDDSGLLEVAFAPAASAAAPRETVAAPREPVVAPREPVVAPREPVAAPRERGSAPESSAAMAPPATSRAAPGSDDADGAAADAPSVPVGEFDAPAVRSSHDPQLEVRGDATVIDASHLRTEQTEIRQGSAKVAEGGIAATLRHAPSLPRRRGLWGDMRYVFTVWLGGRRSRRELAGLEKEQLEREQTRRRHLTAIGRAAATAAELDQTQIRRARHGLSEVATDREKHAAAVGDCDAEMEAVRRARLAKAEAHRAEIEELEKEQAALGAKLEPLARDAAAARRKATDLRNELIKLDGRIRNVEAGRGKWADQASAAAELAALRAERQGVARDEPLIAAQLDSLVPRIASIEAARERLRRKVAERNDEEEEDRRRSDELLAAIGAKRKVVERATGDAEKARDRMLAELGERLYVDRPTNLAAHLAPIDGIDLELGAGQRRIMEIKEILASVDRWKVARGALWWTLLVGALGAVAWLYLSGQIPFLSPR